MGFGGCGKACKPDGFVDPPPICLSNPRRRSHCVARLETLGKLLRAFFLFFFWLVVKLLTLELISSSVNRTARKVYMGRPGELFAKKPMVGEAGYKVVELSMPPLSIAIRPVESRLAGDAIDDLQVRKRTGTFL